MLARLTRGLLGVVTVVLMAVALVWLCYRAVAGWQRAAAMMAERRARATVDMFVTAFVRDMRGAQLSLLAPAHLDDPSDLNDRVTSGFARFQYPESFFVWRDPPDPSTVLLYVRTDRYPSWLPARKETAYLPMVSTTVDRAIVQSLTNRLAADAARHRHFSTFNFALGDTPCQVVALLAYGDPYRERLVGAFGFTVNLSWVRQSYFQSLTNQIGRAAKIEPGVGIDLRDEHGAQIIRMARTDAHALSVSRALPLAFFDPIVADVEPGSDPVTMAWSAEAVISEDPVVLAAQAGARQTTVLALLAASLIVVNYLLISRTATQSARMADMRTTFLQGVTHELKTPVATIRAIGETLATSDTPTAELTKELASISVEQAKRLTRLIDNLLAYSRITDVTEAYRFEAVPLEKLIPDVVREFSSRLAPEHWIDVQIEGSPPPIRGDVTAIRLVLSNLIDNAIRYSADTPYLRVRVSHQGSAAVVVEVEDRGAGIPKSELPEVTRRFFRGRSAASGGSGLGLAIVDRIVRDHGGTLAIDSEVGKGTRVSVTLPVWPDHRQTAD
jgi:signal transduction histidine kinase